MVHLEDVLKENFEPQRQIESVLAQQTGGLETVLVALRIGLVETQRSERFYWHGSCGVKRRRKIKNWKI